MRGAATAGMCLVLEAAGLTQAFDRVYGVSAGALNGWALCAGQAAVGAMHYQDAVAAGVVDVIGPLRGRPLVDFELLFEDLIGARRPLSFECLTSGPDLRVLATSLETMTLRVLQGFEDGREVLDAVRASAFLPRFSGAAPLFHGESMADGGLLEPIPFDSALDEGATHVLVLRSRPADYRKRAISELAELLALRGQPEVAGVLRARHATYNRQAARLQENRHPAGSTSTRWSSRITRGWSHPYKRAPIWSGRLCGSVPRRWPAKSSRRKSMCSGSPFWSRPPLLVPWSWRSLLGLCHERRGRGGDGRGAGESAPVAPAGDGDVRARGRHVADERVDLGRRARPAHDGQRSAERDRARGSGVSGVHPVNSKVGDLIGRKRAYVLGLRCVCDRRTRDDARAGPGGRSSSSGRSSAVWEPRCCCPRCSP